MTNISEVLEKIRSLNRLAQSSNVNEATNAAGIAAKLIAKHRISEEQLKEARISEEDTMGEDEEILYQAQRIVGWKSHLACLLAEHFGCKIYNDCFWQSDQTGFLRRQNKTSRYKLIGRKSDREVVAFMFAWLVLEIERLTKINCAGKGHVACNSFSEGMVSGIHSQLLKMKEEVKQESTTPEQVAALVRIDARLEESNLELKRLHPKSSTTLIKNQSFIDRESFAGGKKAGQNIHLGKHMSGKKTKLLGS